MRSSPNRLVAVILGGAYLLIGAAGFFVSAEVGPFDPAGGLLFGIFSVNLAHTIAHVVIGAALVLAGVAHARAARTVNALVGATYLGLGIAGLFVVGTPFNVLAINGADNVLHFGSSVLLLAVGLGAERERPA